MNIAFSGSRDWPDTDLWPIYMLKHVVRPLYEPELIILGDNKHGVDNMMLWACRVLSNTASGYTASGYKVYEADWNHFKRGAGHERNGRMIADADMLFAFMRDPEKSPGTQDCIKQARAKGIPVYVYTPAIGGRWYNAIRDQSNG